jgi:hypothetical protein
MRSEPSDTIRTYATFRLAGDKLDPHAVTRHLRLVPTLAYAKDERYSRGDRSQNLTGRTGVWFFSTKKLVASQRLVEHADLLMKLIMPGPTDIARLHQLIRRDGLDATMTLFWFGRGSAKKPAVPRSLPDFLKLLPASLETDFQTEHSGRKAA